MVDLARLLSPLDEMEWKLRQPNVIGEVARYFAGHAKHPALFELELGPFIRMASDNLEAWQVVVATLRRVLRRVRAGTSGVPAILAKWAFDVAAGDITRPTRPKGRPSLRTRNVIILETVETLHAGGCFLEAAFDAIAQRLQSTAVDVGDIQDADGVRDIYRRRPRSKPPIFTPRQPRARVQ